MLNMLLRLFTRLMIKGGAKAGEAIGKAAAMPSVVRSVRDAYGEDGVAVFEQAYAQSKDFQVARQAVDAWAERREAFDNPPALHGSARFATLKEAKDAGLITSMQNGAPIGTTWLGQLMNANTIDDPFYGDPTPFTVWDQVGSIVTVAPSRSGKGTCMIIPSLFFYRGSAIVIDPKGENFEATARHRVQMGPVYRLDPFGEHTNAFNPMDYIKNATDAKQLADTLFVSQSTGDGVFHDETAQTFLRALILYVKDIYPKEQQTLATVRALTRKLSLREGTDGFNLLAEMASCGNAVIEAAAEDVLETSKNTITNIRSSFASQLGIWDEPSMQAVTARTDFSFEDLKEQSATVYVVIPIDQMETAAPLVRVFVNTALKALRLKEGEVKPPVLMVLDEFLSFGRIDELIKSLTHLAGYGVRPWLVLQDLHSAKEIYGDRFASVYTQAALRSYFGVDDQPSCEALSKELGTKTTSVDNASYSLSGRAENASAGHSANISYQARPVWTPDEVRANMSYEDNHTSIGVHFVRRLAYPIATFMTRWFADEGLVAMSQGKVFYAPLPYRQVFAQQRESFHTVIHGQDCDFEGWSYKGYALSLIPFNDGDAVIVVDQVTQAYLGRFAWWWQALGFVDWCSNIDPERLDDLRQDIAHDDLWFSDISEDGSYRTS